MKNLLLLIPLFICSTVIAEDNPLHVAIVFDDSYSMDGPISGGYESRISVAKKALVSVVEQLPNDAHVGIILLNEGNHWAVPVGKVNKSEMISTIKSIRAKGGTPLGTCTERASKKLMELKAKKPYSRFRLLIVTDGEADSTEGGLINRCIPEIIQKGVAIDAIGLDMAQDHSLATQVNNYRPAQDVETLVKAILQTFAEISSDNPDFAILEGFPDDLAFKVIPEIARFDVKAENVQEDTSAQSTSNAADVSKGTSIVKVVMYVIIGCIILFVVLAFISNN